VPTVRPTAAFFVALALALLDVLVLLPVDELPVVLEPVWELDDPVMVVEPVMVVIVVMDPEDMESVDMDIVDPDTVDAAVEAEGVAVTVEAMGNCGVKFTWVGSWSLMISMA